MANDQDLGIRINVTGGAQAAAEAQKVAGAFQNIGVTAKTAVEQSAGITDGFSASLGTLAAKIGGVAATAKLLHSFWDEFKEGEEAAVTLTKLGVSASEAAQAGEVLEGLEWLTGSKVAGAQLMGRALNGLTRELRQYGIEVAEDSTRTERWAAVQEAAAAGMRVREAEMAGLTGNFKILAKGITDWGGEFLNNWAADILPGIREVQIALGNTAPVGDALAAQRKLEIQVSATEAALRREQDAAASLRTTMLEVTASVQASQIAHEELRKEMERKSKVEDAKNAADADAKRATVDELEANGIFTKRDAEEAKARIDAEATKRDAEKRREEAAQALGEEEKHAKSLREDLQNARHTLGRSEQAPAEDLDKMSAQIADIESKIAAVDESVKDHQASLDVAEQGVRSAQEGERGLDAQNKAKGNEAAAKKAEADREAAAKNLEAERKRRAPGNALADTVDQAAGMAASPEQREKLHNRAKALRDGGASDSEIDDAQRAAGPILDRRSRRGGEKGEEARELRSKVDSQSKDAKDSNAEAVKAAGERAGAAADAAAKAAVAAFGTLETKLNSMATDMNSASAKAAQSQRSAGQGGG